MPACARTLISLVVLGSLALATAEAQPPSSPKPPASQQPARPSGLNVEELQLLGTQAVRDQIKLTKPQNDKLQQLTQQYRQEQQQMLSELEKTGAGQREQKLGQLRQQATQRLERLGQQVGQLLTPEQQTQLQRLQWQMTAYASLSSAGVTEQLGLSPQQQQQLQQIYQQTEDKVWQLQQQAAEQVLQVLTPQQQEQLKALDTTAAQPQR